jgi:hypothetical protein
MQAGHVRVLNCNFWLQLKYILVRSTYLVTFRLLPRGSPERSRRTLTFLDLELAINKASYVRNFLLLTPDF